MAKNDAMIDVFGEFAVTYLTESVGLDPRTKTMVKDKGLITYNVYAKNAEDAILRLREQEPQEHPITEVAKVEPTGVQSPFLILPREWGVDPSLLRIAPSFKAN